jgi:hypothetical protein
VPTDAVDVLMKQAADEAGIELSHELPSAATNTLGTTQQVSASLNFFFFDANAATK